MNDRVAKIHGADIELGNALLGAPMRSDARGTGRRASRALLREIDGIPHRAPLAEPQPRWHATTDRWSSSRSTWFSDRDAGAGNLEDEQDWGRKFLPANGGCAYIDLDHLELALPETRCAFDHVAAWHAMVRVAQGALTRANEKLAAGQRILLLANNTDGLGHSYGSHYSFLLTRRAWINLFHRRLHHLLVLGSYLASSIVMTGAGKVGSENRQPRVDFQISQRADFFERLVGSQTTFARPLVNARDEALADSLKLARLHLINFDNGLCHVASLLKVGPTQIVTAMLEAEDVDPALALEDPVDAVHRWSRDVTLTATARLISGERVTAIDLQRRFQERARRFVERGEVVDFVPRAPEILSIWNDTLEQLAARDWPALASRLDWVLKRSLLERTRRRHGLDWQDPKLKHLDHLYSSLDPEEGLYWTCERAGLVERLVTEGDVRRREVSAPSDTRAWARSRLLDIAGLDRVVSIDWHRLELQSPDHADPLCLLLSDPSRGTEAELSSVLAAGLSWEDVLARLDAQPVMRNATYRTGRAALVPNDTPDQEMMR